MAGTGNRLINKNVSRTNMAVPRVEREYAPVDLSERISRLSPLASILLALSAMLLWAVSLKNIDIYGMNGLGLVSVLPLPVYVALGTLIASFCLTLHRRRLSTPLLLLHIVVLLFILYGTTILVTEVPRGHVPWRHAGFTEYLMRGGNLDGRLEFYFNFPGFFALSAFVTSITGFQNPLSFMAWAPLFFNLLYLGPLVLILRSGTVDKRLVALGVWLFYLANWVGQDYFVPQALTYFLYLVILGVLLRWFKTTGTQPAIITTVWSTTVKRVPLLFRISEGLVAADRLAMSSRPWQRVGLMAIIATLMLLVVSSHPLTPWFLLLMVTTLIVFNRVTPRGLPILTAVLIATWISFMAVAYLKSAHADNVVSEVGNISSSISENVTNRVRGNPEHVFIVYMRLATTAGIWSLALLGGIRSLRQGNWYPSYILLAGVPFSLLVLQPYGGEMLLRVYLFSLPAVAFFTAALFYPAPRINTSWRTTALIGLISGALLGGFLFARYGDERTDNFTYAEYEAVQHVYDVSEPGAVLVAVTSNLPWKFQDYEKYYYRIMTRQARTGDLDAFVEVMENDEYTEAYLILSRSQSVYADSSLGWAPGTWEDFERSLIDSNKFERIFANDDASIYAMVSRETAAEDKQSVAAENPVKKKEG